MNLLTIYTQKELDAIGFIAIVIAVLVSCALIFVTNTIVWLSFKKIRQNNTYKEYVIWSNFKRPLTDISNGIFLIMGGFSLFIVIASQIYSLLIHS